MVLKTVNILKYHNEWHNKQLMRFDIFFNNKVQSKEFEKLQI